MTGSRLRMLNGRVTLWLARLGAVSLTLMMALTFCDVAGRYLFNAPITGTVEITELMMALLVYFGIGLTTHSGGHIRMDLIILRLGPRVQALLETITGAITFAFCLLVVWRLWGRAETLFVKGDGTTLWEVPIWPVAYAMAASSIFLPTSVLLHLVQSASDLFRPGRRA